MKTGPQIVLLCELSAFLEPTDDLAVFGQIANGISEIRIRFDRKDLAVDPKASDLVFGAESEGGKQCIGVRQAEAAQFRYGIRSSQLADGCGRRRDELDRLISKRATEAEAW
jgi:hypothetical protein